MSQRPVRPLVLERQEQWCSQGAVHLFMILSPLSGKTRSVKVKFYNTPIEVSVSILTHGTLMMSCWFANHESRAAYQVDLTCCFLQLLLDEPTSKAHYWKCQVATDGKACFASECRTLFINNMDISYLLIHHITLH